MRTWRAVVRTQSRNWVALRREELPSSWIGCGRLPARFASRVKVRRAPQFLAGFAIRILPVCERPNSQTGKLRVAKWSPVPGGIPPGTGDHFATRSLPVCELGLSQTGKIRIAKPARNWGALLTLTLDANLAGNRPHPIQELGSSSRRSATQFLDWVRTTARQVRIQGKG